MKVRIRSGLKNLPRIDYRKIQPFQGDLKDFLEKNYLKLVKSLEELGFSFPFFVWFDAGIPRMMDGHGRLRLMKKENVRNEEGGYDFPYVEIEAKDTEEAKKLLLAATSQYQTITQDGFYEFAQGLDEDWLEQTINFDAIFTSMEQEEAAEDGAGLNEEVKGEIQFAEELDEKHNYLVLYFDSDVDWLQVNSLLQLPTVKAKYSKPGFESRGVGRVVNGPETLEKLRKEFKHANNG